MLISSEIIYELDYYSFHCRNPGIVICQMDFVPFGRWRFSSLRNNLSMLVILAPRRHYFRAFIVFRDEHLSFLKNETLANSLVCDIPKPLGRSETTKSATYSHSPVFELAVLIPFPMKRAKRSHSFESETKMSLYGVSR